MPESRRMNLIRQLEEKLEARVLALVTGDREGLQTRIAGDALPLIASHLTKIGQQERLALFLYTPGGDTIAGWGIVSLLRQYTQSLAVVVPFKALSTGTLIAIGADELYMGRHGFLSPVDPSIASPYNPTSEGPGPNQKQVLSVSVEDMVGFLDLAQKELRLSDQQALAEVLRTLADKVHPLALGAVYRAREQSSSLARRLLERRVVDSAKVGRIVDMLTKELPTHSYLIGRDEAQNGIGLDLQELNADQEEAAWALYEEYASWLKLTQPYSAFVELGDQEHQRAVIERAAIEVVHEGTLLSHVYVTERDLFRVPVQQAGITTDQVAERNVYQGWRTYTAESGG